MGWRSATFNSSHLRAVLCLLRSTTCCIKDQRRGIDGAGDATDRLHPASPEHKRYFVLMMRGTIQPNADVRARQRDIDVQH